MNTWVRLSSAFFLVSILCTRVAVAQPAAEGGSDDKNARAVELGRAGLEAYQLGDWAKAYESFDNALGLSHSPVFLLYMARSKRNQGALLAARELYTRVPHDMPSSPPEPWQRAVNDAREEMVEVAARIPSVVLGVRSSGAKLTELKLDGRSVAPGVEHELDPGSHRVVARASDGSTAEHPFVVEERQRRVPITLAFSPAQEPVPANPLPPNPPPVDTTKSQPKTLAYVAGAIGLGGIVFGSVTGLVAMSKLNEVKKNCDGNRCDSADEPKVEQATTFATMSTVGFVVGGVGLGASVALFVF